MNFVYCTDVHYGAAPVVRKDYYNGAILKKLEFCLKVAEKHNAVLLIGGDLFDKPNQGYGELGELVSLLDKYSSVRVIVNRGNPTHDGLPSNSPLTLLETASMIETSDNLDYVDIDDVRIIFAPNLCNPMTRDCFMSDMHKNWLMTHHLIVEKSTPYPHFLMDEFVTDCDLVFCADYHPKQGYKMINGTMFIAPGSIARRKYTKDNIEKIPECVLICGDKIKTIKIPFVEDVWVEKEVKKEADEIQETEMDIDAFKNEIECEEHDVSLQSAWAEYCNRCDMKPKVRNFIYKRIFERDEHGS